MTRYRPLSPEELEAEREAFLERKEKRREELLRAVEKIEAEEKVLAEWRRRTPDYGRSRDDLDQPPEFEPPKNLGHPAYPVYWG